MGDDAKTWKWSCDAGKDWENAFILQHSIGFLNFRAIG